MSNESALENAEEKARKWKATAEAKAAELREYAAQKASAIRDYAKDTASQARDRFGSLHSETEELVRTNPNTSILVAFGAGVLVGLLLRK